MDPLGNTISGDALMSSIPEDLEEYEQWEDLNHADEPRTSTSTALPSEPPKEVISCPEGVPMLDLWLIHHPRSAEWSPPDHIDKYLTTWLRCLLDKSP